MRPDSSGKSHMSYLHNNFYNNWIVNYSETLAEQ